MLGEKEMLVKKNKIKSRDMLQFPSGLFRSELEPFSVWDLRKFAFSSQASFFFRWWAGWYDSSSKSGASQRAQLVGIETKQRHTHK